MPKTLPFSEGEGRRQEQGALNNNLGGNGGDKAYRLDHAERATLARRLEGAENKLDQLSEAQQGHLLELEQLQEKYKDFAGTSRQLLQEKVDLYRGALGLKNLEQQIEGRKKALSDVKKHLGQDKEWLAQARKSIDQEKQNIRQDEKYANLAETINREQALNQRE